MIKRIENKKRTICQLMSVGAIGGAERFLESFAKNADRAKFNYHFIFLFSKGPVYDSIKSMDYPVFFLGWENGFSIKGRYRLIRLIKNLQPDIIHSHISTPFVNSVIKLFYRKTLIYTQHGSYNNLNSPIYLLGRRIDDRALDLILANSKFTAQKHHRIFKTPPSKIKVVYLGIDLEKFHLPGKRQQINIGIENRDTKIGFLGRLEDYKGALHLPAIANELINNGFEGFQFRIAGDGSAKNFCEKLASENGTIDKFNFLGWVEDVKEFLYNIDIFIFPSIWDEPLGLVLLEALAAELPIIAYDSGAVKEILEGINQTFVVPKGDIEAMSEKLLWVCNNIYSIQPNNEKINFVRDKFNIKNTISQIEEVYEEYLS